MNTASRSDAYALTGVDTDIERQASAILYAAAKESFKNRIGNLGEVITPFDDFSGVRVIDVSGLPEGSVMCMGFDTTGTKVELAHRMGVHNTIAYDLFAMVCDDAALRGAEPVLIGSTLDLKSLGTDARFIPIVRELAEGYVGAAKAANVAIINGEIAQMGSLMGGYGDFPYHWGAACVWFARKEKLFTGKEIRVGDSIVMLGERGFRANGLSLVRNTFEKAYGEKWHDVMFEGLPLGIHVLQPSIIYCAFITMLHGGFSTEGAARVHGVVHITGGGMPEKFARVLRPSTYGANLTHLFEPCSAMLHCQQVGDISDHDAYGAWNMGQGMAIITPDPDTVILKAAEWGLDAKIAGDITNERGLWITSRGITDTGKELTFDMI